LQKNDTDKQLCYYQPGIGTYIHPGVVSPLLEWGAKILDQAVAWYLNAHVQGGYQFLMQNWESGDKICIFGFSRGAYTARALAGMLHKIGLLPKDNPEQLPLAYRLYNREDEEGIELAAGFKHTFCRDVMIEFVGVWDTVASVGLLTSRTLPFTTTNTTIKTFRHALSLDEHRAKFRPNLYHRSSLDGNQDTNPASIDFNGDLSARTSSEICERIKPKKRGAHPLERAQTWRPFSGKRKETNVIIREDPSGHEGTETDVLEVWFAGCHADVGGGSVSNKEEDCLGDISLRWMVRQIQLAQCSIQFDQAAMERANISAGRPILAFFERKSGSSPPRLEKGQPQLVTEPEDSGKRRHGEFSPTAVGHHSTVDPTEHPDNQKPDEVDAVQPIHDQLRLSPLWWLLEIVPTAYSWQDAQGKWQRDFGLHRGKGRTIPDIQPNFHESVKTRIEKLGYKPRATYQ